VWKSPASDFNLLRAEIDANAKAWCYGVQEIGRQAADLQYAFAGRYNETEKLENLFVIVCVLCNVVSAPLAYPFVMLTDLPYPAFKGGRAKPAGGRGFGYRILISVRET
jgi:hypothetical protein